MIDNALVGVAALREDEPDVLLTPASPVPPARLGDLVPDAKSPEEPAAGIAVGTSPLTEAAAPVPPALAPAACWTPERRRVRRPA
ncbi:hypothetical protein BS329_08390 [Amycolatopsis coloradensis]|uniref:Uncharacterized protein n=1 Tax=Amycolatopsis coloradensis TaxID=76021 RepID=A0A1R0KYV7_9PSEU|nr:hypothetical protein BS329_08390 [Amycolatopsis coloradensis]